MLIFNRKLVAVLVTVFVGLALVMPSALAQDKKMGYVDLRRAFYEYEKAKNLEAELNSLTEDRQQERTKKIEVITKLRDEAELLSGDARTKKQTAIDSELVKLQEFDRTTRQQLLTKKNDMFREVIEDIQKVVQSLGEKGNYDFILDSRSIMYAKKDSDITDQVVTQLNK